jgi:hypothetical protein
LHLVVQLAYLRRSHSCLHHLKIIMRLGDFLVQEVTLLEKLAAWIYSFHCCKGSSSSKKINGIRPWYFIVLKGVRHFGPQSITNGFHNFVYIARNSRYMGIFLSKDSKQTLQNRMFFLWWSIWIHLYQFGHFSRKPYLRRRTFPQECRLFPRNFTRRLLLEKICLRWVSVKSAWLAYSIL